MRVLLLNGIVRAFNGPAGQAFLPLLVPEEHFPNAVAWGSSIFQARHGRGPMCRWSALRMDGQPGAGLCLRRASHTSPRCCAVGAIRVRACSGRAGGIVSAWSSKACDTSGTTS